MKNRTPLISVIMSVRNGQNYLQSSINSILNQSFKNFEFIVINDASVDSTGMILNKVKDRRLIVVTNTKKKGLTRSLNTGLKISRGKFIARMDGDDISRHKRFEKQINLLDNNPEIGIVGTSFDVINPKGKIIDFGRFPLTDSEIRKKIFRFNPIRHSTVMFKKELVKKYGNYDVSLDGAEDYDLWLRYIKHTKIVNLKERLLKYRIHSESVSEKEESKVLKSAIKVKSKAISKYHYPFTNIIFIIPAIFSFLTPKFLKKKLKQIIYQIIRNFLILVQKTSLLSSLSIRLVKLFHKSPEMIHPKHLIEKNNPWFVKYLNRKDIVLDIGCNNGQNTLKAAKFCRKMVGFDLDINSLSIAQREIDRNKINNVKLLVGNAEKKLQFKDNYFDKILCFAVLEHVNNRKLLIREIKRVLKSQGLLFLSVPNRETKWKLLQKNFGLNYFSDPDHKIEYSYSEIKKVLADFKLKVVTISPVSLDMPFVGVIDVLGSFSLTLYRFFTQIRKNLVKNNINQSISFEIVAQNQKEK